MEFTNEVGLVITGGAIVISGAFAYLVGYWRGEIDGRAIIQERWNEEREWLRKRGGAPGWF